MEVSTTEEHNTRRHFIMIKGKSVVVKIAKMFFVICSILSMVCLAIILKHESISIRDHYSLDEIEDDQAVMGITLENSDEIIVVDKKGRWKYSSLSDAVDSTDFDLVEVFDSVLRDENIPYQEHDSGIGKRMLTKAVNVPDFELRKPSEDIVVSGVDSYYVIAIGGKQRHQILIGQDRKEKNIKWDVNLLAMCFKLRKLIDKKT